METLTVIARDEAEHAALAAAVLAWCFAEGGPAVGAAVQQAANKLPSRVMSRPMALAVDAQILADHGVCQPDHDGAGFSAVLRDTLALVPDLVHAAA